MKQSLEQIKNYDFKNGEADVEGINMVLLRILTTYIQTTGILTSAITRWPSLITDIQTVDEYVAVASSDVLSLDCMFGQLRGEVPQTYFITILVNLIPVTIAILGLLFWIVWFLIKKRSFKNDFFGSKYISTLIIIFYN